MRPVSWNLEKNREVEHCLRQCLPEFSHVNHYWDKGRKIVVAKILPGEFYFTHQNITIATTLGSCISACIWDPMLGIGGMNHFMLPLTDKDAGQVNWSQRGKESDATRYGNFAMEHLINIILKNGGRKKNLVAKLFGGGNMLKKMSDVGMKNLHFALRYLATEKIRIEKADVGLDCPRKVLFEPATGRAFVKRLENLSNDTIAQRERDYRHQIDNEHATEGSVELF
ncbi:chemoreceptor glutamine deamidase CheD [Thalassomonas viridans]|uniref:Probable chemoreceptor glutamine deamidase CheD n=2 Tax=Thalassomonas viridans TaxID=137584 RepID=A0AAF0CD92_9GAMM|nr:chemoreceptor glutamine deamidase CheD [Thalassomonas viridans]WDE08968.1 chemoreceptor glutamine deamidase CheD [Thalassomonas viridans]